MQINANCDWGERGGPDTGIPQLNFSLPLADEDTDFCYDIPMGVMTRKPIDMDMPGNSFITALPSGSATGLMLSADTKYGFRGISGTMSVSLIRSSYEPDPVPEYGQHNFKLAIGPVSRCPGDQLRHAFDLWHPFNTLASTAHGGELPLSQSLLELDNGDIVLQGVKMAEDDGNSVICRLYNAAGQGGQSTLRFHFSISESIELVDLNERTIGTVLPIRDNTITIDFKPYELINMRVCFKK